MTQKGIEDVCRENKLTSLAEVKEYTKAGSGCGSCHDQINEILAHMKDNHSVKNRKTKASKIRD